MVGARARWQIRLQRWLMAVNDATQRRRAIRMSVDIELRSAALLRAARFPRDFLKRAVLRRRATVPATAFLAMLAGACRCCPIVHGSEPLVCSFCGLVAPEAQGLDRHVHFHCQDPAVVCVRGPWRLRAEVQVIGGGWGGVWGEVEEGSYAQLALLIGGGGRRVMGGG